MNGETFQKWMKEYLIRSLKEATVIVMDNASYHSQLVDKQASSAWDINDFITYLKQLCLKLRWNDIK